MNALNETRQGTSLEHKVVIGRSFVTFSYHTSLGLPVSHVVGIDKLNKYKEQKDEEDFKEFFWELERLGQVDSEESFGDTLGLVESALVASSLEPLEVAAVFPSRIIWTLFGIWEEGDTIAMRLAQLMSKKGWGMIQSLCQFMLEWGVDLVIML